MNEHIEAIRIAVAGGASAEAKANGVIACRAILTALGAEPGKTIAVPGAPTPHPLANIDPGQALDLLIAKLTAALPKEGDRPNAAQSMAAVPASHGLRIAFVSPPQPRPTRARGPRRRRTP